MFNPMMNVGDPRIDVEQETIHYHRWSVAPTEGQGIPNYVDTPSEQYNGIAHMICAALAEGQHTDPDKSVLTRAGIKLDHPETCGRFRPRRVRGLCSRHFEVAQNELFTRGDQHRHAGQLLRHSPYR